MKKLLGAFFVFLTLTIGVKVSAFTLNDALLQIQNLQKEVSLLKLKLGANALNTTDPAACKVVSFDVNPKIINVGDSVTIKWETQNCKSTAISASDLFSGFGVVTASGTKTATPKADLSYYLVVSEDQA